MNKIAIILTDQYAEWEYALIAGTGVPYYGLDIRFFTPKPGEVRSMGGLTATIPNAVNEIPDWSPDALVVVGGTIWGTDAAPDLNELLQTQHEKGCVIAGICGGTLALARSGLLNTTPHTSNDADFLVDNAKGYEGAEQYRASTSAVSADRIITAPGSAPASFAAAVFESVGLAPEAIQHFKDMLAAEHA